MSRQRKDSSLADEAARWRRLYREAQVVITEQNRALLGLFLRDRLADPSDFTLLVDGSAFTDLSGRIDWARVDLLVREIVDAKPHLRATHESDASKMSRSEVEWFQQQSA